MESTKKMMSKTLASFLAVFFTANMVLSPVSYAQVAFLPPVGTMVNLTPKFNPLLVKGVKLFPDNPFKFEFIVDTGDKQISQDQIKVEGQKLVSYFLAALTTPEKEMWVNLSPYENSRIIPQGFGDTEMGKELLAQDYLLKQIMATALYPERQLGKEFWNKVYGEAAKKFGTTNVPVNTFNKVWILPNEAVVYENAQMNAVFVVQSSLKVMLEQDYLAANKNKAVEQFDMDPAELAKATQKDSAVSAMSAQIIKEIVIPALEKEVNEGANFAKLRQVYQGLILAAWYKKNLKDNVLSKGYVDQGKTKGVDTQDKEINQKIYQQYLKAYKKGAYNYVKEDVDPVTNQVIPRKYFSGGVIGRIPAIGQATPAMVASFNTELNDAAMAARLVTLGATALLVGAGVFGTGTAQAASYQDFLSAVGSGQLTLNDVQVTRDNFDSLSKRLKGGEVLKVSIGGQVRQVTIARGTNGLGSAYSSALAQPIQAQPAPAAVAASVPVAPPAVAPVVVAPTPPVQAPVVAPSVLTPTSEASVPSDYFSKDAFGLYDKPVNHPDYNAFISAANAKQFKVANLLAAKILGKAVLGQEANPDLNNLSLLIKNTGNQQNIRFFNRLVEEAGNSSILKGIVAGVGKSMSEGKTVTSVTLPGKGVLTIDGNTVQFASTPGFIAELTPKGTVTGVITRTLPGGMTQPITAQPSNSFAGQLLGVLGPQIAADPNHQAILTFRFKGSGIYFTDDGVKEDAFKFLYALLNKAPSQFTFLQRNKEDPRVFVVGIPADVVKGLVDGLGSDEGYILGEKDIQILPNTSYTARIPNPISMSSTEVAEVNTRLARQGNLYLKGMGFAPVPQRATAVNPIRIGDLTTVFPASSEPRSAAAPSVGGAGFKPVQPISTGTGVSGLSGLNPDQIVDKLRAGVNRAVSKPNRAQLADPVGGIDLEKVNVMIKNGTAGTGIKTAFADPRILELMRSAQGLFVQIESVVPMTPPMVNMYLGMNAANVPVQSADQKTTPAFPKSVWVNKEQVLA